MQDLNARLETLMSQRASLIDEAKRTVDARSRQDRLVMAASIRRQADRVWDELERCKGE
jgi:hypothetical protein